MSGKRGYEVFVELFDRGVLGRVSGDKLRGSPGPGFQRAEQRKME
jgi:hypothetical protein